MFLTCSWLVAVISCFLNESMRVVIAGNSFVSISVVAAGPVKEIK